MQSMSSSYKRCPAGFEVRALFRTVELFHTNLMSYGASFVHKDIVMLGQVCAS